MYMYRFYVFIYDYMEALSICEIGAVGGGGRERAKNRHRPIAETRRAVGNVHDPDRPQQKATQHPAKCSQYGSI